MLAEWCFAKHEGCLSELKSFCNVQSDALRVVLAKIEGCLSEFESFCSGAKLARLGESHIFDDSYTKTANFENRCAQLWGGAGRYAQSRGGFRGGIV